MVFTIHNEELSKQHKQKYRLFACFLVGRKSFKFFLLKTTAPPVLSGLRAKKKGERSRNSYQLAPFQGWKGGEQ